jgi:SAM-dependent methyltransferase
MLEGLPQQRPMPVSVLDFGCGASHLYEYIQRRGRSDIAYTGLDLSHKFLALSRQKFPDVTYYDVNVLETPERLPEFDYVVLNGIFNVKMDHSFDEMLEYFKAVVSALFRIARIGIAFNVMSKHVEWERSDLFHLPFDTLAPFLRENLSRHFVIRHDYGLFEYTTYVYKDPSVIGPE